MNNAFDTTWKKILQHKFVAIFFMIIVFCLLEWATYVYDHHKSIIVRFYAKIFFEPTREKARDFYRSYATPMRTDEYIMLMWMWPEYALGAERLHERDPFFRIYADELRIEDLHIRRRVDSKEELAEFVAIFGVDEFLYDVDDISRKTLRDPLDDFVIKALYCDTSGYDQFDYGLLGTIRDRQGGYGDTHYLLSILFLERLDCVSKEQLREDKVSVINDIFRAQKNDQIFSDLYAERVVLLYWAGQGDLVRMPWVKRIADNIQSDGGWKDIGSLGSDPHTTGLAVLAIKYFISEGSSIDILIK